MGSTPGLGIEQETALLEVHLQEKALLTAPWNTGSLPLGPAALSREAGFRFESLAVSGPCDLGQG